MESLPSEAWTTALKQGRGAGLQTAGIALARFPGIVGSQLVKVFDLEVGKTGLNLTDEEKMNIPGEEVSTSLKSRAG